ncbi:hypothetical protein SAMN05421736_101185 [Evansella caseinilytica]|uniref:Tat pathway signal sequence domain protein n=1 Tax=Evansella caseinilytica TaxID=1503961 RepID=A0A1H3GLR8_9BACI|nr:hypothetical protein [Evansella caseinilytica]SDY03219.1 hypothetical protein SAMN05421736_101185 [Evansella caseinilytica]
MKLRWLKAEPKIAVGVTWGVPWKKGVLNRHVSIALRTRQNNKPSVQTWPLAYWPDGSVKWTGHASVFAGDPANEYVLTMEESSPGDEGIQIRETEENIEVDTGCLQCTVSKSGETFLTSLALHGKLVGGDGKLVLLHESCHEQENEATIRRQSCYGRIEQVEVEQAGPVRAVIKIAGKHCISDKTETFPFLLRLYFYQHVDTIKFVHTFIYNGNEQTGFIRGLGIIFSTDLQGEAWNRNLRFAGDEGFFSEPGQLLRTRKFKDGDGLYEHQIAGKPVSIDNEILLEHVRDNARWNDFKLVQDSASHYKIVKRTETGCSWVTSTHGARSNGTVYVGGETGGIAAGIKNFWQKHPTALQVEQLTKEKTFVTLWLWSPDGEPMDFRHYSKTTHVLSAYEGFDERRAEPQGIANTSEAYMKCFAEPPDHEQLKMVTAEWQQPSLLVCEPEYYYESQAAGIWSLPDDSNPLQAALENELVAAFQFYKQEVEQRSWYGFWNYGDVMHSYDPVRHEWCYDLGGFAWQNTELVPNIWLWYSFLRTGNAEIFRMAEAMTRHTSEVDCYHTGKYAPLGSRHNVVHWGCGCKEARISMAGLHKYYYFLTADERTGELLSDVKDADQAVAHLDPLRAYYAKGTYPTHARTGPDWAAFCSNWLTEWERTENPKYQEKIRTGINCLKALPLRLLSGPTFEYDPATAKLHHIGDGTGSYHMVIAFGAPQVWWDIARLLEDESWEEMMADFGEVYLLSEEEKQKKTGGRLKETDFHWPMFAVGIGAYAAAYKNDRWLAEKAWALLLDKNWSHTPLPLTAREIVTWRKFKEIPWASTNGISQWCLNTIMALEFLKEDLPEVADFPIMGNKE